jgi:hypothetical protein
MIKCQCKQEEVIKMVTNAELIFWCVAGILAVGFFVSACLLTPHELYVSEYCIRRACGEKMH